MPRHNLREAFNNKINFNELQAERKKKVNLQVAGLRGGGGDGSIPLQTAPKKSLLKRTTGAISSAFDSAGVALSRPEVSTAIAQFGAAIAPESKVAQGLAGLATSVGEGRSQQDFLRRIEAGEDPTTITGGLTGALTPEARASGIAAAFKERQITSLKGLRSALAGRATAQARGEGSVNPIFKNFALTESGEPSDILNTFSVDPATGEILGFVGPAETAGEAGNKPTFKNLALTEGGEPSNVLNTFSVDPTTGEILKFIGPAETEEEKIEKALSGAEFGAVDDLLIREFIGVAEGEIREGFEGNEEQLQNALRVLDTDPLTGGVAPEKVFNALSNDSKREFKRRRQFFERGLRGGKLLGDLAIEALPSLEITTEEEFNALAPGERYVKDGVLYIKVDDDSSQVVQ